MQREDKEDELSLVVDYLTSECYPETLEELQGYRDETLDTRKEFKTLVLDGAIDEGCKVLLHAFPGLVEITPELNSMIFSQKFIECIRKGKTEEALSLGRMGVRHGVILGESNELFLLLAYKDPEENEEIKRFMDIRRRAKVVHTMDGALKGRLCCS